eukprot:gnl/MRDRNA2_/MRDRNA2_94606_c0_seq1.p1 gnl/MRDRNA2_/MRDRNA2_94606_c0~~gnl/MRDRNA2_/MRDRNA2_94606_c0_seq1.p1  ORF type:complete len:1140 (+),score=216.23 gnl/MRDRNA2_/MRDRNA2_94606_c0_seq1:110-3529(+)
MVLALMQSLFAALVCIGAQGTQGALHGRTTQRARHVKTTHHSVFLAKPNQELNHTVHDFWLNLERHVKLQRKLQRKGKLQDALRLNFEKRLKHLKASTPIKHKKSKKSKIFKPNNRTAELAANQDKPLYKHMLAVSKSFGLAGNTTHGVSFHLGRHTRHECGHRWEEGCKLAVACYNTFEDGGCCQQWDGNMDLTGACAPCADALGYCDECYQDSQCGHHHEEELSLEDIFKMIDADGSSSLSRDEIKNFAMLVGDDHSKAHIDRIMAEADKDGNDLLDYEEFEMFAHAQHEHHDEDLKDAFNMADADRSGGIDREEMGHFLESHDDKKDEKELDHIMWKGDNDGNKVIDFEEFKQLVDEDHHRHEEHRSEEAELEDFFKKADKDDSGTLTKEEIRQTLLHEFGMEVPKEELDHGFDEADKDRNGVIDWDEFKAAHEAEEHEEYEDHGEWTEEIHHEELEEEWGEGHHHEHVGDWEDYDKVEEKGMDPSAVSNPCGDKWDMGCSDAFWCYEEGGCCDVSVSDHPEIDLKHSGCSACGPAIGICDDCFPESACGAQPGDSTPKPPAPPATYWTIIGRPKWATHSSGEKHPECLAATSTTSQQSNKYGNKLGVVCCDGSGVGSRPGCKSASTYEGAESHCESHGLQLCTRKEIENGAGKGTGCGFDAYLVWTSTPCDAKVDAGGGDDCLIADPKWHCLGSQCIPAEDYELYTAQGGAWCLTGDHELCQKPDKGWCSGECNCPGNCPHACGRCPASASLLSLPASASAPAKKELFMLSAHSALTVALHSDKEPSNADYGDPACSCVGIDNVEGKRMVRLDERTTAAYPVDLGASCQAWDDGRSLLGCMSGQDPGKGKGWCAQKWCYVDPCKCDISTLPKTSLYLPGATYQGKPIYYSYATCGAKDMFTVNRKEACVNQMTEAACDAFPKCGWHEGRCMGKELIGTCQKKLHGFTWGRSNCRCIGVANLLGDLVVNVGGKTKGKFPTEVTKYPADLGATCQAWDNGRHPDCKNKVKTLRPDWCEKTWCYVDPCSCDASIPPKTSKYLPDASFQGKPIYYSYHTCGSEDSWTAKHHKNACVNQKSEEDCAKHSKCAWTSKNTCVGKEIAGMCPGMAVEKEKKKVKSSAYASTVSFMLLLAAFMQ